MTPPRLCAVPSCARPAHNNLAICVHCTWLLGRDLDDAPELAAELDVTRYRLSAVTTASTAGGCGAYDPPLPFDPRAAAAAFALHQVLDVWAARIERAVTGRARPLHTEGLTRWLHHHHGELAGRDDAAGAVTQIGAAVGRGWRVVDRPADRVYAGTCGCGEQLYAQPGHATVTCRACDTEHHAETRRADMQSALDGRLMTGAEIARLAQYFGHVADRERARNLIKVWAGRGQVVAHGHTDAGAPLYPFGETLSRLLNAGTGRNVASAEYRVLPSEPRERTPPGSRR